MRKAFLILAAVVVLAILGMSVFIATFNADRYRPLVVSELQETLGRPVKLERIALAWRNGIAVQLNGLAVYEDAQALLEPLVQVESVSALIRLMPLLRKQVHVSSVVFRRPRVHVARDAQGDINLMGLAALASPAAASGQATVGHTAVSLNIVSLRIEDGTIHWTDALTTPPTNLWIKALDATVKHVASGKPMEVDVRGALGGETSNVRLSGRLTPPNSTHQGSVEQVKVAVEGVPLEQLLPAVGAGEPHVRGKLTMTLHGGAGTLDPARFLQSISGRGDIKLDEPTLANLNVLRAVFEKFSMIPGLVERLETRLPQEYRAKFADKDTTFSPINVSIQCEAGTLRADDLQVRTDAFGLAGSGTIGFDRTVNVRSTLRIDRTLSAALIKGVNELRSLTNREGEMEIPLTIHGQAPRLAILPDLNYVASKVIVTTAVDLLGGLLEDQGGTEGDKAETDQANHVEGGLLGQFLRKALEHDAPSGSTRP
jgi:uncharacterized protein YhdP